MTGSDDPTDAPASSGGGVAVSDWRLPWEGGCRCGGLRFRVTAPPILSSACHCRGCQRMTASAFSLSLMVPEDGFEILSGAPVRCGAGAAPHAAPGSAMLHHMACPVCASWLFTRMDPLPGFVNLRATLLDDASWIAPFVETCRAEGLAWADTPARHSFPGFPPEEAWAELAAAYAREGVRPSPPSPAGN